MPDEDVDVLLGMGVHAVLGQDTPPGNGCRRGTTCCGHRERGRPVTSAPSINSLAHEGWSWPPYDDSYRPQATDKY